MPVYNLMFVMGIGNVFYILDFIFSDLVEAYYMEQDIDRVKILYYRLNQRR